MSLLYDIIRSVVLTVTVVDALYSVSMSVLLTEVVGLLYSISRGVVFYSSSGFTVYYQ